MSKNNQHGLNGHPSKNGRLTACTVHRIKQVQQNKDNSQATKMIAAVYQKLKALDWHKMRYKLTAM